MLPLCLEDWHRRDPLEPARPRAAGGQPRPRRRASGRPRGADRRVQRGPVRRLRTPTSPGRGPGSLEVASRARAAAGAGRTRVAAAEAGGHGADRRGDEASATSRTRSRRREVMLSARGDRPPGGAVRAACGVGDLLSAPDYTVRRSDRHGN